MQVALGRNGLRVTDDSEGVAGKGLRRRRELLLRVGELAELKVQLAELCVRPRLRLRMAMDCWWCARPTIPSPESFFMPVAANWPPPFPLITNR